ncbi:MAG: hypothetical protein R2883_06570 [Caldisericia bacterium]
MGDDASNPIGFIILIQLQLELLREQMIIENPYQAIIDTAKEYGVSEEIVGFDAKSYLIRFLIF